MHAPMTVMQMAMLVVVAMVTALACAARAPPPAMALNVAASPNSWCTCGLVGQVGSVYPV
mgnify:CR=1 FL=1